MGNWASLLDFFRPNSTAAGQEGDQAPPKRLANALEGLGRAIRHIADVRSGADLLLEALDSAAQVRGHETGTKKASDGIQKAADTMRKALDDLRATGTTLMVSSVSSLIPALLIYSFLHCRYVLISC
jgi:mediator of RNA polymerase II transcription subunit 27